MRALLVIVALTSLAHADVQDELDEGGRLYQRGELFEEDLDRSDPWQFKNVLV